MSYSFSFRGTPIISGESRPVPTMFPARRCAAPGCGEKIKGDTWEVALATDPPSTIYVCDGCFSPTSGILNSTDE